MAALASGLAKLAGRPGMELLLSWQGLWDHFSVSCFKQDGCCAFFFSLLSVLKKVNAALESIHFKVDFLSSDMHKNCCNVITSSKQIQLKVNQILLLVLI